MEKKQLEIDIRYTELSDGKYLKEWLMQKDIGRWFPMLGEVEVEDAVNRWLSFSRYKCSLTAVLDGVPIGLTTLYLNPYKKISHQCEFGIIVGKDYRGQGVGTDLLKNLIHLAKDYFNIELLHLQVYDQNPAIGLYEKFGFKEFGRQTHWIKEGENLYQARIFMEKFLKPEIEKN
jgi:putative acetyltransferase